MKIKLKYFGVSTVMIGHESKQVELPDNSTIEHLIYKIHDEINDPVDVILKAAVFLVNKSKANKDTVLHDGDELLILYTLGGG